MRKYWTTRSGVFWKPSSFWLPVTPAKNKNEITLLFLRAEVSLILSIKRKNHVPMRYPWISNFGEKKLQVYSSGCFKTPGIDEKDLEDTNQEMPMGLRNNLGLIPVVVGYIAFLSCSLGMYLFKVSLNRKTFDENFGEFFFGKIWNDFGKTRFHDTEKG